MNQQHSPLRSSSEPRLAVLLNGNAKRVRRKLIDQLAAHVAREDIYYSTTLEEAERFCQEIYEKRYDMVFTGGGDGTLLQTITQLRRCQERDGKARKLPVIGVLKLGTGNAVASILGAHSRVGLDLSEARKNPNVMIRPHRWVTVEGQDAPFAGVGYDSLILNHYRDLNRSLAHTPFSWLGRGGMGYFASIVFKSIPASLFKKRTQVELYNSSATEMAYLLGSDGRYVKEFAPGELMFSGAVTILGASTIPCFGFGFQMFPFAKSGERMQIRATSLSALEAVWNLPSIWRGEFRSPKVFDFHATQVEARFAEPELLQIGGDAAGAHKEVEFALSKEVTYLADMRLAHQNKALPPAPLPRPRPAR